MPAKPTSRPEDAKDKIDYRDVLPPDEFRVYAQLRDVRKALAAAESVPVYNIFRNEQLASMVQSRSTTPAALEKVAGISPAKIEKYGQQMLAVLSVAWSANNKTNGQSV